VILFGLAASWWVASPGWTRLGDSIVGDNGDAMWQLSVMRWTLDGLWSLELPWTPPMFFPTTGTYAYSDPMVTQAVVAAPLRAIGASPPLQSNLVLLFFCTAGFYLAWRLLRRVCGNDAVAVAGATAWAFSELRVATVPLFQLVTAAALVPFVFERLFVMLARPTIARGLVLGATVAAAVLAALYYGPLLALTAPTAAVVWFVAARKRPGREHAVAAAAALVVAAVLLVPIAVRYQDVHDRDHLERASETGFSAGPSDLNKVSSHHDLLAAIPGLEKAPTGERALFPGLFVVAALPTAALLLARRKRRHGLETRPGRPELLALLAAGLVAYLLASGTELTLLGAHVPAPLGALYGLPGFSGIRAPVRFAVLGHLALVAGACCVIGAGLGRIRYRPSAVVIAGLLVALPLVDAGSWLPTADVTDRGRWSAVNVALRRMPRGPVLELPILQSTDGVAGPRIEAPRLYLAAIDGNPRVNGYSGYQPPRFAALASALNAFPSAGAVATLRRLGVRYVVLRTDIVGHHPSDPEGMIRTYGTTDAQRLQVGKARLSSIRTALPPSVRELGVFGGAVLLQVGP
jgi:hypothetical protein